MRARSSTPRATELSATLAAAIWTRALVLGGLSPENYGLEACNRLTREWARRGHHYFMSWLCEDCVEDYDFNDADSCPDDAVFVDWMLTVDSVADAATWDKGTEVRSWQPLIRNRNPPGGLDATREEIEIRFPTPCSACASESIPFHSSIQLNWDLAEDDAGDSFLIVK